MATVRAIVLLFGFPAGQQLDLRGDKPWYEDYFFSRVHGQAGYWAKQSDNEVILTGWALDWAFVNDPNPTLTDRGQVVDFAIATTERSRRVDFSIYDLVIVVVGVPDSVMTDGGATTARSSLRTHAGVVIRVKDRFDFVAHEIGHAIGLNHSYGDFGYKNASWSQPGEYGHPYCLMSAMGYGGTAAAYVPALTHGQRPEYTGLGPSLNAATALSRGWLDAYHYDLVGAQPTEIVLRSRHWGGRDRGLPVQALNVRAADGQNYVVEYRENEGWDRGQGGPALIISHGRGSTADQAHPDTDSATFLRAARVPITFGGPGTAGSRLQGPGFGLQPRDRSQAQHTMTFTVFPGDAPSTHLSLTSAIATLNETVLESGETNFEQGERVCLEGVWPYRKVARSQIATFEVSYALAVPPIVSTWTVDGEVLAGNQGTLVTVRSVRTASATLDGARTDQVVRLRYDIEPLPVGSRLRLSHEAVDERFTAEVVATLSTDLGAGTAVETATFEGVEYVYPTELYDRRASCIANFGRIADSYLRYEVLLLPDLWRRVPEERFAEIQDLLKGMSHPRGLDDQRPFEQSIDAAEQLLGMDPSDLRVVALDDVLELARPEYQPELVDPALTGRLDRIDEGENDTR